MAVRRRKTQDAALLKRQAKSSDSKETDSDEKAKKQKMDALAMSTKKQYAKNMHLIPLPLQCTVLLCSGFLFLLAYRDLFATGKVMFGDMDLAMLHYTRSITWYDDSNGWKSSMGGLSAVRGVSTDENDMGGFFVRKMTGAVGLAYALQKLVPVLVQDSKTDWKRGHYTPLLLSCAVGNGVLAGYYVSHWDDLVGAGAEQMALAIVISLVVEMAVFGGYCLRVSLQKTPIVMAKSYPVGKGPASTVHRIVARTVAIVTGFVLLIASRDFFFTGYVLPFPPGDEMYLEWTGAFFHSPPNGSHEAMEYGMEAPLHSGDKFLARLMALYFLVIGVQKVFSSFGVRLGKDRSGEIVCRTFWKSQTIGNIFVLLTLRLFAEPSTSASLDLRWHLMCIGYETFILGLYAYY